MTDHSRDPTEWAKNFMKERQKDYRAPQRDDPLEYLVEVSTHVPVFGNPGYIERWEFWSKHDTAAERDAALKRLREYHPRWTLRARDRNPYLERLRVGF